MYHCHNVVSIHISQLIGKDHQKSIILVSIEVEFNNYPQIYTEHVYFHMTQDIKIV